MKKARKTRKTRVTKKETNKVREENKLTSYVRKKRVIPGPWTELNTKLSVKATLKLNKPVIKTTDLKEFWGAYLSEPNWGEKGWYPILFNIVVENITDLIEKHGIDEFMAAVERSINTQKGKDGKPKLGTVILMNIMSDGALATDTPFISIKAKTNKKSIEGFRAIRKGKLITL